MYIRHACLVCECVCTSQSVLARCFLLLGFCAFVCTVPRGTNGVVVATPPHMPVCALGTEGRNEARCSLAALFIASKEVQQLAQLLLVRGCCVFVDPLCKCGMASTLSYPYTVPTWAHQQETPCNMGCTVAGFAGSLQRGLLVIPVMMRSVRNNLGADAA